VPIPDSRFPIPDQPPVRAVRDTLVQLGKNWGTLQRVIRISHNRKAGESPQAR